MLIFDVNRVLRLRGIQKTYTYLVQNGFTHITASRWTSGKQVAPKIEHIERLCRHLNCTPNDFFQWRDVEGETPLPENHALNALRREKTAEINNLIKDIPLEKLGDVEEFLKELKG